MDYLTKKQARIVSYIEHYWLEYGYPPTIREIAKKFKIAIGTVQDHISALKNKGYLKSRPHTARGFEVIHKQQDIPIFGTVAAGNPIFAVENIEGYLGEPPSKSGDFFALKIKGDSMIEAGIREGDLVKVKKQKTAENGDIVIALLEDEATVKTFRKKGSRVYLQPANPAYHDLEGEFEILGVVVELRRRLQ